MDTIDHTQLKRKTKQILDKISVDKGTITVRRSDKEDVVMMPVSEYNSWTETDYLLASRANRKHLIASIRQADKGDIEEIDRDGLWH